MRFAPGFLALALAIALSACPSPQLRQRAADEKKPNATGTKTVAPTPDARTDKPAKTVLFFMAHPEGNPAAIASILETEPRLKLVLIFPPDYFAADNRQAAAGRFKVLQSSGQVEIALTLANEPNLALIENIRNAGSGTSGWDFDFSWPEDVAAHVARGSGAYQKAWGSLPSGFFPPHGAATEKVVDILRRFRLNWVILTPSDAWGVTFQGGTAVLVPQPVAMGDETLSATATAEAALQSVLERPFALIDAAAWPAPDHETRFLRALAKAAKTRDFEIATPFVAGLGNEYAFPKEGAPFAQDHSNWVRSTKQRRAWQALADARLVVENYKNSGRANLVRLDAAIEEICNAEGGTFLLALGPGNPPPALQRNFLATLANVYRLAGVPVPANLNTWFADRSVHRIAPKKSASDRPFFVESASKSTWNDPEGDDTGPGTFIYPAGVGPKGLFDLQRVSVSWTDSDVTISYATAQLPGESAPMVPVLDLYIDVNRIADAGRSSVIRQRGNASVAREAAWEYAVTLSPRTAVAYQGLPGAERILGKEAVTRHTDGFSATFSRSLLRGDPRQWRLSAALGAMEPSNRDETPNLIPVTVAATPKSFGGASTAQQPPAYIDVLSPSFDDQAAHLGAYETGGATLPYVEAD